MVLEYNMFVTKIHEPDMLAISPFNPPDILKTWNDFKICCTHHFNVPLCSQVQYFKHRLEKLESLQLYVIFFFHIVASFTKKISKTSKYELPKWKAAKHEAMV